MFSTLQCDRQGPQLGISSTAAWLAQLGEQQDLMGSIRKQNALFILTTIYLKGS